MSGEIFEGLWRRPGVIGTVAGERGDGAAGVKWTLMYWASWQEDGEVRGGRRRWWEGKERKEAFTEGLWLGVEGNCSGDWERLKKAYEERHGIWD